MPSDDDIKLCTKCGERPQSKSHCYCLECKAAGMRAIHARRFEEYCASEPMWWLDMQRIKRQKWMTSEDKFHASYIPEPMSGCWIWIATIQTQGYGMFCIRENEYRLATHVSWELEHGKPFPSPLHALHRCDNPPCVNPDHIFIGTHQDNMADMLRKGRAAWQKRGRV